MTERAYQEEQARCDKYRELNDLQRRFERALDLFIEGERYEKSKEKVTFEELIINLEINVRYSNHSEGQIVSIRTARESIKKIIEDEILKTEKEKKDL